MSDSYDRYLGMDRPITRRDFINGMTVGIGGMVSGSRWIWAREQSVVAASYPPERTGMRGSHPGSFETAHALRDGTFWKYAAAPVDTGETYDLVIVGGGISGLAAAHFYRERAGSSSRILILENHDDFGGHAKRNEFHIGGRLQLLNGGTLEIDSPTPYSPEADGLLKKLGIHPEQFQKKFTDPMLYRSLGLRPGVFFNRETFGTDRLVAGLPGGEWGEHGKADSTSWTEFLAKTPLSKEVKADIAKIQEGKIDYMPGLSSAEKKSRLSRMSYRDFLLNIAKVDPGVIPFYQTRTHGEWGAGIDAEPALDCWALGLPGFEGMGLEPGAAPHMSYTAAGYANGGSYRFHFPDGNASIARLLVRSLLPQAVPGKTAEDVITSRVKYGLLDLPGSPVRIRLNSTVVRARNIEDRSSARRVDISYAQGNRVFTVGARGCVLACWNMMIPYLCPELPEKQKQALHYLVKVPLVYTSVGIRNWTSFQKLGVDSISSPGCYHSSVTLNAAVNMGDYASPKTPEQPILLHLVRTPCKPGLPVRDQHRAGRLELQTTSFQTFERNIRDQLARTLSGGGFDPARDIEAITVNRWPHGYGYEYNPLFDPDWPESERPNVIGRKPFGRITIANSDSGATAYTDVAINQAFRAVKELE
ncbi:MAG: NAD(P)-binding protein [Bryobacteraceae bacterium]